MTWFDLFDLFHRDSDHDRWCQYFGLAWAAIGFIATLELYYVHTLSLETQLAAEKSLRESLEEVVKATASIRGQT